MVTTMILSQSVKHPWKTVDEGGGKIISSQGITLRSSVSNAASRISGLSDVDLEGGYIPGARQYSGVVSTSTVVTESNWNMVSLPLKVNDASKGLFIPWLLHKHFLTTTVMLLKKRYNLARGIG